MAHIIIADAYEAASAGLVALVQKQGGFTVTVARSLTELTEELVSQTVDLVILGEWLPDGGLLSTVENLRAEYPNLPLILIAGFASGYVIDYYLQAGLNAYLCKLDGLSEHLPRAIQAVMRGEQYLSPSAQAEYSVCQETLTNTNGITGEHLKILDQLIQGHTPHRIAEQLGINRRRVYHLRRCLRLLFGVANNEALIMQATQAGVIYPFNS